MCPSANCGCGTLGEAPAKGSGLSVDWRDYASYRASPCAFVSTALLCSISVFSFFCFQRKNVVQATSQRAGQRAARQLHGSCTTEAPEERGLISIRQRVQKLLKRRVWRNFWTSKWVGVSGRRGFRFFQSGQGTTSFSGTRRMHDGQFRLTFCANAN